MRVLLTKKLDAHDIALMQSWQWQVDTRETLAILPVDVPALPDADVWVISSRNSFPVMKKFARQAPKKIYCVGNWIALAWTEINPASEVAAYPHMQELVDALVREKFDHVLFFCGDAHRHELEEGLRHRSAVLSKIVTHRSEMIFPVVNIDYDAVFVFSPRSAESLLMRNNFGPLTRFACIGRTTEAYLNSRGISNTFVPSYPDSRILVEEFYRGLRDSNHC